jgi:hypothetical protein
VGGSDRAWDENDLPRSHETPSGQFTSVLEEEEQVVRLGRAADDDSRGLGPMDRGQAARGMRTGTARRVQPRGEYPGRHSSWPRVVALISWIVLLMVLCWFYVFPWLERILPENF